LGSIGFKFFGVTTQLGHVKVFLDDIVWA